MKPVFNKGTFGCLYCMKIVNQPLLMARKGEKTSNSINELNAVVQAHRDRYPEIIERINNYKTEAKSGGRVMPPYFTFIKPWEDGKTKDGPLERDTDNVTTDLAVWFKDLADIRHNLIYDTYVCPHCYKPLNRNTYKLDIFLISIFGIRNIGKTQFIKSLVRKCDQGAFHNCGFSLLPDEMTANQKAYMDSMGQVEPTADLLDNEDNFYSFILSWSSDGQEHSVCLVFQDTPGEPMLSEADPNKRMNLISKVIQSNIILLFCDPTRTRNFITKLTSLLDNKIKPWSEPDGKYYFSSDMADIIEESRESHKYTHLNDSFEETVRLLCNGLDHIKQERLTGLNIAVVYTKLDFVKFYYTYYQFYTGKYENESLLFVENDDIFTPDPPDCDPLLLWQDWKTVCRGQAFMLSEDRNSLRRLSGTLKRIFFDIPCFMIANGQLKPLVSKDSLVFDNVETMACYSLILWIIKNLNPSNIIEDLEKVHQPTKEKEKGVMDLVTGFLRGDYS
ncbi:MAG: hypothetical protein LBQ68_04180 [Clostridiales bacterium]|jgi:hypothetical protein|nr:hypothetical protein [Clostridiales bacterium]